MLLLGYEGGLIAPFKSKIFNYAPDRTRWALMHSLTLLFAHRALRAALSPTIVFTFRLSQLRENRVLFRICYSCRLSH